MGRQEQRQPAIPEQQWSYVTKSRGGDLLLGLLAGPLAHLVGEVGVQVVARVFVRTLPVPAPLWYGSWGLSVAVAVLLVGLFFRRFPALMSGFVIGTVPAAVINLLLMWFGAGLAGRAVD